MSYKTVVITGGSKGIGLDITQAFLENDYKVYVGARSPDNLAIINHPHLKYVKTDVREESQIENLIKIAYKETSSLDILINNAGYSEWRTLECIDKNFLEDMLATNLMSVFWSCKVAARYMKKSGSIINISSIAGKRGSANNSAYVATKFALNGLTQSLAKELGERNIRVNGICPVLISTDGLINALYGQHSPANGRPVEFIEKFALEQSALKRLPTGPEVAAMCIFLASNLSSAITGQNINIDCGVFPQ
jgi:3-oxoacyl-[acyl-carrier protein] reductase/meso-butanediol dehydrogenase/(S,S)-butanediol dehydrogenase/diacetyl reductase